MAGVIDIMNYAPLVAPGLSGTEYQFEEFQTMVRTTLRPLLRDGIVTTQWGREVDVAAPPTGSNGLDLKRCVEDLHELPLRDASTERILRQNAIEFLGL